MTPTPSIAGSGVSSAPIISLAGLTVVYQGAERPALDGIDLDVRAGEYVGIMGLNGAGKTTLGLALNGVVPQLLPAEVGGRIDVAGADPRSRLVREMARTVGIAFDNPEFQLSQLTVAEEVAFGLENLGVPPGDMPARIGEALGAVGLEGLEDRSPFQLSGGQQQRLAIAAVIVMRPRILFLDEPTSNLDPAGKADILKIANRLHQEGMTILVADHEIESLAEYADRIVVLDAGRIAFDGPPGEVFGHLDELAAIGLRAPQVTEFAHALRPAADDLPVTVAAALAWLDA